MVRQPAASAALIGRRFYDEEDDWRGGYDDDASDLYRSAMAYRCFYCVVIIIIIITDIFKVA